MSASPSPAHLVQDAWTAYSTLQLLLPAVSIFASVAVAVWVSRTSYKNTLKAQASAAALSRDQRAHDELLGVLAELTDWLSQAESLLRTIVANREKPAVPGEKLPRVSPGESIEVGRIEDAAVSLKTATRRIRDTAVHLPIRNDVLFYLDQLGPSIRRFWTEIAGSVENPPPPGPAGEQANVQLRDSLRYVVLVRDFCIELRVLVRNSELRKFHDSKNLEREEWHWLTDSDAGWGFKQTPPYLPAAFSTVAAACEARRQFMSEPEDITRFGEGPLK